MGAKGKTTLTMNIREDLLKKIDDYRFEQRFASRTEAIEWLLDVALKQNPKRPK
jgi:metal-responsive CopG/Arc/MetJ family transcriptional regulator